MGVEAERRETEINQCLRLSVFYDVLFRPSLIPSADALKEHGLETGGACVGNTLGACGEEDFPCKYRPFRIKPVLPLHRQGNEVDGRVLCSICSLHSIECLIHL